MRDGYHNGVKAVAAWIKTQNGEERGVIQFKIDGESVYYDQRFTGEYGEQGKKYFAEALVNCGWNKVDTKDFTGVGSKEVDIKVVSRQYNDKTYYDVKYVNAPRDRPESKPASPALGGSLIAMAMEFDKLKPGGGTETKPNDADIPF